MYLSKAIKKLLPLAAALTASLIAISGAISVSAAPANRWIRLVSDKYAALYVDTASIQGKGRYRYYWQQIAFKKTIPFETGFTSSKIRVSKLRVYSSIDCSTKIARIRRVIVFDKNGKTIMEVNIGNYGPRENLSRSRTPASHAASFACRRPSSVKSKK